MIAPQKTNYSDSTSKRLFRPFVVGVLSTAAIAAVVIIFYFMSSDKEKTNIGDGRGKYLIAEVEPQIPSREQVEAVEISHEPPKPKFWEVDASKTNGFSEAMIRKWKVAHYPPPCYTNTTSLTEEPPEYAIFAHPSENYIAAYLTIKPGQTMVGTPVYGVWLEHDFLMSCEEPIVYSPDDDDKTRELKDTMKQVKIELRDRMRNGESLSDILTETHREVQKLSSARQEIQNLIYEESKYAETEEELDDLISAANRVLEEKGIAPISANPIVRRNIRYRAQSMIQ